MTAMGTAETAATEARHSARPWEMMGGVTANLPLDDIRVIDLTVARAGPTCVRQLADWGADVIRVEPPPAEPGAPGLVGTRHGPDFQNLHRNKRSLSLNLKAPGAHDVLMHLVDSADSVSTSTPCTPGTRGWSTARSPGSARTGRTPGAAAWIRSPRAWAGS